MVVNLRVAQSSDAEQIAALHADSWRHAYRASLSDEFLAGGIVTDRLELWTKRLQSMDPGQYVVVAEHEGEIIGFACAYLGTDHHGGILLDNIHVSRPYQGQGIGRRLMSSIAEWCAETVRRLLRTARE